MTFFPHLHVHPQISQEDPQVLREAKLLVAPLEREKNRLAAWPAWCWILKVFHGF